MYTILSANGIVIGTTPDMAFALSEARRVGGMVGFIEAGTEVEIILDSQANPMLYKARCHLYHMPWNKELN